MEQYVIVGNGIAGITAAQTIVRADPAAEVHIFGAEPYPYYRRPILWEFIAGQIEQEALFFRPTAWYTERGIRLHLGVGVTALNPQAHSLTLADGSSAEYDRLLLATGCRPFIPPFEGVDKKGVYTLRTIEDAISIKEHSQGISTAAIIGGGLLGIETARALTSLNLDVSVIEFMPHLLPLQLDAEGAQALQSLLESMGMRILAGAATEAILAEQGTIDKFLGDAIMAFFNAPISQSDHTLRAVRAAIEMRSAIDNIQDELPPELRLGIGIGVHSGEAVLGLVGTQERLEYTAIGDSVNIAKRLQENAAPGQILISAETYVRVTNSVMARPIDPIKAKGKSELIDVLEISGLETNYSA